MSRDTCPNCEFIISRCLCDSIIKLKSNYPIIIFRAKNEKKHALNTVNILKHSLDNLTIIDLDDINNESVIESSLSNYLNPLMVFPTSDCTDFSENSEEIKSDVIIFLDGSWNKTKKLYFESKILKNIPAIKLLSDKKSEYKIRQSSIEYSLSTIEAVSFYLNAISKSDYFDDLIVPLKKMVSFQIEKMKPGLYEKNYKKKGDN